jgi:trigger factor
MKYDVKSEKGCKKVIEVVVDSETIEKAKSKVIKSIKENAVVNGYRKGKVPEEIIKTQFADKIKEEVLKEAVNNSYMEIMKELQLKIVTDPNIAEIKYNENNEILYKIIVEVAPEFEISDYKNIKIKEKKSGEITEKDIERELNKLRQYRGTLKKAEHEKVKEGDFAVVSIAAFIDNQAVAELTTENYTINVGSNTVLKEIEDGIKGMKREEEKEIKLTFPEDYFNKNYSGKKALFKVKLNEINEMQLPEANDEFAKTIGNFNSISELKDKIKEELQKQIDIDLKNYKIDQIIEKLLQENDFDIPEGLVIMEMNNLTSRYIDNLAKQGLTLEKIGRTRDEIFISTRKQAENNIKLIYMLLEIAKREKIEVTDSDIENEIKKTAIEMKQDAEQLISQLKARGNWELFRTNLLEEKVIEYLLSVAKV